MGVFKKIALKGEEHDVGALAQNVFIKDELGLFNPDTFTVEEALQQVVGASANFANILDYGGGTDKTYAENAQALIDAQATGKVIYFPPGQYELDNCDITLTANAPNFIVYSNEVTIKRADDPELVTRATDRMLNIEGDGVLENFKWYGYTLFDGNEGSAYEVAQVDTSGGWGAGERILIYVNAGAGGANLGICYIENHDFRNCYGRPFYMNGATATPRFEYARIDKIHLRNCGLSSWRFRVRIKNGFVEVGDISTEETGGDRGLRWSVPDTQGEYPGGGFGFELGETAIQGTHTQLLKIRSYTQRYPKYGGINWLGVKNVIIGDYFIYNPFRNDDDTVATMDGGLTTRKIMKIGSYLWNKNMSEEYSVDINRLVVRNQANAVGGLPTDIEVNLEIDDSSPMFNIGWLETDSDIQFGRPSTSTELISEPLRIGTLVWHGSNSDGEIDFNSNIVVDNFILTDRFEDSSEGQSRIRAVYIKDTVKINSVTRENGASCTWWVQPSEARNEDGAWGWNSRSNIEINNGDLGAVYLNLNLGLTGGNSGFRPGDDNFNASTGCAYLKARFTNCKMVWRNYVTKDNVLITLGNGGLSDVRDRLQFEFIDCKLKEHANGSKALLLDSTTGIRTIGTSGLIPIPGESPMIDDLGGDPVVIPGTNDLPNGEYIGPSRLVNTRFALFDEEFDEGEVVVGWGHLALNDSGNYFSTNDAESALQELGQKESLVQITSQPEYNALSAGDKALSISYIRRTIELTYPLNTLTGVEIDSEPPTLLALPGSPPTEIAGFTNGILFDTVANTDTYARIVLPSSFNEIYVQMYVYFDAYLDSNNGQFDWILGVGDTAQEANTAFSNTSGAVCVRYQSTAFPDIQYYTQPSSNSILTFSSNPSPSFNTGQWFKVGMHLIRNGIVTFYLDGEPGNITKTVADFPMNCVRIGRYTSTGTRVVVSGLTVGETGFVNL